jgi:hypothetical protein
VFKIVALAIVLIFLFTGIAKAQVGIGIWPSEIEIEAPFLKTSFLEIHPFSLTEKNVSLMFEFQCKNCEKDVNFFGKKVGSFQYLLDVEVDPKTLEISSFKQEKIMVKISNPLFLKAIFKTEFFGKNISIPFYLLHFDKEKFNGRIIATTQGTKLSVSLSNKISINLIGINKLFFIISIAFFALIIALIYREYVKKIYLKYS